MRILVVVVVLMVTFALHAESKAPLDSLLERRQYFELRTALAAASKGELPAPRRLYFEAFVHNFFHDLAASNRAIEQLFAEHRGSFTEQELGRLLGKKIENHIKLYEYAAAHAASELLLGRYGHTLTEDERQDVTNSDVIWKGLAQTPAQRTHIAKDSRIYYMRDKAGLINVPVTFKDSSYDFVFDTGANLSVITESYAAKAGLAVMGFSYKVRAITGIEVDARMAVARQLKLGDVVVENVVFIVFPDSVLSFAGGAYQINGIIGFPVIEQLQEVRIDKGGFMTVPKEATNRSLHNFGIDDLMPVVQIQVNKNALAFTFDTGAQITDLNQPFYEQYRQAVESTGKPVNMQQGGAGGYATTKAWQVPVTVFNVGGQSISLPNLHVKTTNTNSKDRYYYGNLGQDVLSQFRELVINFRYMYVDFVK